MRRCISCLFIIIFVLAGCSKYETQTISQIVSCDITKISKIEIFDDTTGKSIYVESVNEVERLMDYIKKFKVKKAEGDSLAPGYKYRLKFFIRDDFCFDIIFHEKMIINGTVYENVSSDIEYSETNSFIESFE